MVRVKVQLDAFHWQGTAHYLANLGNPKSTWFHYIYSQFKIFYPMGEKVT